MRLIFWGFLIGGSLILAGCREGVGVSGLPVADPNTLSVALVLGSSRTDGGWSQSHAEGLEYVSRVIPGISALIIDNAPEFGDHTRLFDGLAQNGFDVVIGAGLGYMDAMAAAAQKYGDVNFINVLGLKSNEDNFAALSLAMEDMMYLAGMVAGARANQDQQQNIGMIASHPVPEQFRMINAAALGIAKTCSGCRMQVRWLKAWDDSPREAQYANELFESGAYIVISATGGRGIMDAVRDKDRWAIPTGRPAYCAEPKCLAAPYWFWGPVYTQIVRRWQSAQFQGGTIISHANQGGMGLEGFMPGQSLPDGLTGIPAETIDLIRFTLARFSTPDQNAWQEVFTGPITDNRGRTILEADKKLRPEDYDQFPPGGPLAKCDPCMFWYAANISSALPDQMWLK